EHQRLFGILTSLGSVEVGRCAETMRRALAPAPCGKCFRQGIGWRQFLRAIELFERLLALRRRDGECQRQGLHCQPDCLVEVEIDVSGGFSRPLDRRRGIFSKIFPVNAGETAQLVEPACECNVGNGVLRPGTEQLLPRPRKPGPPYPAQWRGAEKKPEV